MTTALVIPSNRPDRLVACAAAWAPAVDRVFVVFDMPEVPPVRLPANAQAVAHAQIDRDFPHPGIVSRGDAAIRAVGFHAAWAAGAEVVLTLDDDCLPEGDPAAFVAAHRDNLFRTPRWVTTVPGRRVRGLPYADTGTVPVVVSHGLWVGTPDLDAPCGLVGGPGDLAAAELNRHGTRVAAPGQYFPFSSMNFACTRAAVPLFYFPPQGAGTPYGRFDDIWGGLAAQKVCHALGLGLTVGAPYLRHTRASDPYQNLVREAPGIRDHDAVWRAVDAARLTAADLLGCLAELAAHLCGPAGADLRPDLTAYLDRWGRNLGLWVGLFSADRPGTADSAEAPCVVHPPAPPGAGGPAAPRPPVVGAYHVATFPGWEAIVDAQCARLKRSGLLDRTDEILVGVVGRLDAARDRVTALLGRKARVTFGGPLSAYEFGTLDLLHRAARGRDFLGWYVHTKGVSTLGEAAAAHRRQMETVVMDNHRACADLLADYDACGSGWQLTGFDRPNPHFSGNFWWARASYLRTLPRPTGLDTADRYQAEFWIGKNPAIRPFELVFPSDPFGRPSAWVGLERKYQALCEIGRPEEVTRVVDVGVEYGFSTFHLATDFPGAAVVGVSDFLLHADSEPWVRSHLHLFPNLRIVRGDSPATGRAFGRPVDLVHIDADHSYDAVRRDFEAWEPWVRPGGRVLFHDTQAFPGVRTFFDGLPGRKAEIREHYGLGCWFKGA